MAPPVRAAGVQLVPGNADQELAWTERGLRLLGELDEFGEPGTV